MKRDHLAEQGGGDPYVDWLKSIGCVFYAPLDQENGFKDLISNTVGCVPPGNNNCTVTWDSALDMYVFDNRAYERIGFWWDQLNMFPNVAEGTLYRTMPHTMLHTFRMVTEPDENKYNASLSIGGGDNGVVNSSNIATGNNRVVGYYFCPYRTYGCRTGSTIKLGMSGENGMRSYYKNGALYNTGDESSWNQVYRAFWGHRLSLAWICTRNGRRTHFAIKDVFVFDRALDLATIRLVQGYD